MTHPGKSDHWDSLASELGAKPASEDARDEPASGTERPDAAVRPTPPEAPTYKRRPEQRPVAPSRRAPDWDALASELGLVPEREADRPPPAGQTPERTGLKGTAEALDRAGTARTPPTSRARPGSMEPPPGPFLGRPTRPLQQPPETAEESSELEEEAPQAGGGPGEAAEKKPGRRRRKRRRKPRESGSVVPGEPGSQSPGEASQAVLKEPVEKEPEGDEDRPDSGRSKRRRKRSPPRKEKKPGLLSDEAAPEEDTLDQPEEDREEPVETHAEAGESPQSCGEEDEAAEDTELSKPNHRAIPTWEESVGLIIATNLEARAKNPDRGFSRGRGRGRGSAKTQGSQEKPPQKRNRRG